jgi:hypothetical protein
MLRGSLRRGVDHDTDVSGAVQGFTAAAAEVLNPVLLWVVSGYARLAHGFEFLREHQLAATCRPQVEMDFVVHSGYQEKSPTATGPTLLATVSLLNKADVPLRIESVTTKFIHRAKVFPEETIAYSDARRVLSPHKAVQFDMTFHIPEGVSEADYDRRAMIHCCDLSGLSKYSLLIYSGNRSVRQSVGFQSI